MFLGPFRLILRFRRHLRGGKFPVFKDKFFHNRSPPTSGADVISIGVDRVSRYISPGYVNLRVGTGPRATRISGGRKTRASSFAPHPTGSPHTVRNARTFPVLRITRGSR